MQLTKKIKKLKMEKNKTICNTSPLHATIKIRYS